MFFKPFLRLIAPHSCLSCGLLGKIICSDCQQLLATPKTSACVLCNRLTAEYKVCGKCRPGFKLSHVTVASKYEDLVAELVRKLKYERTVEAAEPLGGLLAGELRTVPDIIVPVPSTAKRFRQRGYNPAKLLARGVARTHKITMVDALGRIGSARQVGAPRSRRLTQLEGSFYTRRPSGLTGVNVLLIDDVVTTGSTLREAATTLRSAGVRNVRALIVAKN